MQIVDLEWGEAKHIHTLVDTHKLVKSLDSMAAHGTTEAHAPILE